MKIIDGVLEKVEEEDVIDGILEIPNTVTEIKEYTFYEVNNIREVRMSDSVQKIGPSAFFKCRSLEIVILSKNIKKLELELFSSCAKLRTVVIPEGIEIIGQSDFSLCLSLRNIFLPNSVTTIETGAFSDCSKLKNVRLSDNLLSIGNFAFHDTGLERIELPKKLERIGRFAFQKCKYLESIELPDTLQSLETGAFYGCESLTEIKIPKKIKKISDSLFYECSNLKNVKMEDGIEEIGQNAFSTCIALEKIKLPDSVEIINSFVFGKCRKLKTISLSKNLKQIAAQAFNFCNNLTEITIPIGVETIGERAFSDCYELRKINMKGKIEKIYRNAFSRCIKLEEILLPDNVKTIEDCAFFGCSNLKTVRLPKDLSTIAHNAFNHCEELNKVLIEGETIPVELKDTNYITGEIIKIYLYYYANSILKEKYQSMEEFLSNTQIKKTMRLFKNYGTSENEILKFKNLFKKLRREYDVGIPLYYAMDVKTTEHFSYFVWKRLQKILPISYGESEALSTAISEIIEIFGLFETDKNRSNRLKTIEDLFQLKSIMMTEKNQAFLKTNLSEEEINHYFKIGTRVYYFIEAAIEIPEEFQVYLNGKQYMFLEELKVIKKQNGTYGKRLNAFVRENYRKVVLETYEPVKPLDDIKIQEIVSLIETEGCFDYYTLHNIFDGCKKEFNEDFYKFLIENLPIILHNPNLQTIVKEIQKQFDDMRKYYLERAGRSQISLRQALDYMKNIKLNFHKGNYELLKEANKAGVTNQEAFDYYQGVYEKNQTRKKRSLLPRSRIYEIDGYTLKVELLRKDDPFSLLVGERNYTNCCQRYHGVGHNCMAHATNSEDGGIFVTRLFKDGEWILLTQSWDWQNNNLYCHDNIEGTEYLKKSTNDLKSAVIKALQLDAEDIIKKSKEAVEKYNSSNEDKLDERQMIKVVTVGAGYDDLGLKYNLHKNIKINGELFQQDKRYSLKLFQPVNYDSSRPYFDSNLSAYSDAKEEQFILVGDIKELTPDSRMLEPIYRDERRIVKEEKEAIRDYTKNKIFQIEKASYDERMCNHNSTEKLEDSAIYLGEDWYLIFEKRQNNSIYISDLARIEPTLEDEKGVQQDEIKNCVHHLIDSYDYIEADLKEDTSYLLYLVNKRLGYIGQIGEDMSYPYEEETKTKIVSSEEQQQILKQIRKIREEKNPNLIMHKVKFKKNKMIGRSNLL